MTIQVSREEGLYYRQTLFDKAKRVVVKVGSAVLTGENGLETDIIDSIARQLSFLKSSGREVILVSSGAVAAGRQRLGRVKNPNVPLREKQALAAMGQGLLMQAYEHAFARYDSEVAQILLTHSDLAHRSRYLNVRNTISTLFEFGVIPIINENDTVSVEELRFGDNDRLSALIANMIDADMCIILTDVDCLYTGNPDKDPTARPVYTVSKITQEIEEMAGNTTSSLGTGGMQTKIKAAKLVASRGGSSFIGPGRNKEILKELFSGDLIGTFFLPSGDDKLTSRKHWIAHVLRPQGHLVIDRGAWRAVGKKGKSLLPSGILEVRGRFGVGASVHCLDEKGTLLAAGLINYCSEDVDKIKGLNSTEIHGVLGFKDGDEVIGRDNLVVLNKELVDAPSTVSS